jgi:hypothetical protein
MELMQPFRICRLIKVIEESRNRQKFERKISSRRSLTELTKICFTAVCFIALVNTIQSI